MDAIEIYKKNARPPKEVLKTIKGGRISGATDIKPQWRYQAMTETFGLIGFGWKFEIKTLWIELGSNDEKTANAEIFLYVKVGDNWSDPIPGIGGASFVAKEKNGMFTSDECYKMAVTDALSVSFKMLGIASDIYMGNFDGSKYKDEVPEQKKPEQKVPSKPPLNKDSKHWAYTLKKYGAGETSLDKIREAYYISPEIETILNDELAKNIDLAASGLDYNDLK